MKPHTHRLYFAYRCLQSTVNDFVGLATIPDHPTLNTAMGHMRRRMAVLEAAVEELKFMQGCTRPLGRVRSSQ